MKKRNAWILAALGLVLTAAGLLAVKRPPDGFLRALPYVLVGIGCGALGHGVGALVNRRAMEKNPALAKKTEIDQKDERNVAIANASKARAWDAMTYIQGALLLSLALMGVDLDVILLVIFAGFFALGVGIYYRFKYDKEM